MIAFGFLTVYASFLSSGTMAVAYSQFHWKFSFGSGFFPVVNEGELAVVFKGVGHPVHHPHPPLSQACLHSIAAVDDGLFAERRYGVDPAGEARTDAAGAGDGDQACLSVV